MSEVQTKEFYTIYQQKIKVVLSEEYHLYTIYIIFQVFNSPIL
jgi:hypothetical protein